MQSLCSSVIADGVEMSRSLNFLKKEKPEKKTLISSATE